MLHGNVASPGEVAPRHFLTVLSKGDTTFKQGSGRLELADDIFADGAPLAARVIVNRVWGWHFGKPLVATPSDFGVQGEKPTHPELLDDLAARFIAHGWSLKWLHREIMLSAAYRQSSQSARRRAKPINAGNSLLWRMNPRRLDIEAYRDTLLRAAGQLSEQMGGPSADLDAATNMRRTVYGRVSRARLNNLLRQYDFPDPMQTSSGRDLTTTSLQQLFLMNSPFIHKLAGTLAKSVEAEPDNAAKVRALYRKILARDPSAKELDLAVSYLEPGRRSTQYAQVLLSTNEEIFWPMKYDLSRRSMIQSLCGGLGSVGLAAMLGRAAGGRGHAGPLRRPASAGQGQAHHLPVHGGRTVAARHVRSQADPARSTKASGPTRSTCAPSARPAACCPRPSSSRRPARSGIEVSELLPQSRTVIDDICVIRSMYTFNPTHAPARSLFHSGNILANRPSFGAWISYGLGSENENLPALRGADARAAAAKACGAPDSCPPSTRACRSTMPRSSPRR